MTNEDNQQPQELELETATDAAQSERLPASARELTLTILYHRDSRRVGEEAVLSRQDGRPPYRLSRLEPLFSQPGAADQRPLADSHLSREPWLISRLDDGGARLDPGSSRCRLAADGETLEGPASLAAGALERGVVLELAGAIVLLLETTQRRVEPLGLPTYDLVGCSALMIELREEIQRVGDTNVPVLLRGETGTGKELVARALHYASERAAGAFVAVNMAAIPPDLIPAELFGATAGAYTGASRQRQGYFRRADRGTLFLDEIGEIPLSVQAALLRALEEGEILSVGSSDRTAVDVRVIAASDSDLETAVAGGTFRAPLLHRLASYEVEVPPLRARRQDIGRLLYHFLREELEETDELGKLDCPQVRARAWLPAELVARLATLDWPGNVRQLRNVARQLVIGNRGLPELRLAGSVKRLLEGDRPDAGAASTEADVGSATADHRDPREISEEELLAALRANRFRIKPTAKQLRIPRSTLYGLIDRSPRIHTATAISRADALAALARHGTDLDAMADSLEVSPEGLKQRLKELRLIS